MLKHLSNGSLLFKTTLNPEFTMGLIIFMVFSPQCISFSLFCCCFWNSCAIWVFAFASHFEFEFGFLGVALKVLLRSFLCVCLYVGRVCFTFCNWGLCSPCSPTICFKVASACLSVCYTRLKDLAGRLELQRGASRRRQKPTTWNRRSVKLLFPFPSHSLSHSLLH